MGTLQPVLLAFPYARNRTYATLRLQAGPAAAATVGVVSAILGGQHLLVRRHGPTAYKAMAVTNFAAAGALGYVAVHNSRIAPMPK